MAGDGPDARDGGRRQGNVTGERSFCGESYPDVLVLIGSANDHRSVDENPSGWVAFSPANGPPQRMVHPGEKQNRRTACSFCGQQDSEARPLPVVTGNAGVAICLDCAELALQILE